jgi:microcystin degradation protein MlrC
MHGGAAGEATDDPEGELPAGVRVAMGDSLPILVTLDGHANVTPLMVRHTSMLIGVKTDPHYDFYGRGLH